MSCPYPYEEVDGEYAGEMSPSDHRRRWEEGA